MNGNRVILGLFFSFLCFEARAASLQYSNATPASGVSVSINAVAFGGATNFSAVGANATTLDFNLGTSAPIVGSVSTAGVTLTNITFGAGLFLGGDLVGNLYSSANGVNWTNNGNVLSGNGGPVGGLAYSQGSNGTFLAVAQALLINYANSTNIAGGAWQSWTTPADFNFFERYFAVTPYGASGFAACGYGGVIRISTDAGRHWFPVARALNTQAPALRGIVQGGSTLVAVGVGGTIVYSTDGGATWPAAASGTSVTLNAVAYRSNPGGSNFIAVGNAGTILESSDGITWIKRVSPTSADLYSVAVANSGKLQDIAVIVGAGGAVLVGAALPTSSVSGTTTICNGSSITITNILGGSTGPWDVTWSSNGVPIVVHTNVASTIDTLLVSPVDPNANTIATHTYTVSKVVDVNSRAQASSLTGSAIITVDPRPTSGVTGTTTICNGSSTLLAAALTGLGPWTVSWSDGFVQTTNAPAGSGAVAVRTVSPVDLFANGVTNVTYTVTNLTDANCTAGAADKTGSATVTVDPRPTSVVTGTTSICNGSSTILAATLTGLGPWIVSWSDGFVQTTNAPAGSGAVAVRTVSPADLFVNGVTNVTYAVTNLADVNCTASPADKTGSATVTVDPRPTSVVTGSTTICNGRSTILAAALTGLGPWTVTWSDGFAQTTNAPAGSGAVAVRTVSPADLFANGVTNVTYTVTNLTDVNCTAGPADKTGSATVTVDPRPTSVVTGTTTICNGSSTILAAALTGLGPWTVTWSDGFVQTTNAPAGSGAVAVRTVGPADLFANGVTNMTYMVTSLTDVNCTAGPADKTGSATVTVDPRPTSVVTGSTTICNGRSTILAAALTGLGPWTVTWSDGFAQTTNAPAGSGAVAVRTVSPADLFANGVTNVTYTVTNLTDVNCTAGPADKTGSATVTVDPRPTSVVTGTTTICNGSSTILAAALTGLGPWTVTWSDGFVQTTNAPAGSGAVAVRAVSPADLFANGVTNVTYAVANLTDVNCTAEAGDKTGSATVTVAPLPAATVISSTNTIYASQTATVSATLLGVGPWVVNWSDSVVTTNGTSASTGPFPISRTVTPYHSTKYTITGLSALNSCSSTNLSGSAFVNVLPQQTLNISGPGHNGYVVLDWFVTNTFDLQSSTNLMDPGSNTVWTVLTNSLVGSPSHYTNAVGTNTQTFFRLISTP